MAEDIAGLLSTNGDLGSIDEELHVHAIIGDCNMCPLVWYITSVGAHWGHFVGTVSFKGEEEAGIAVAVFTIRLDAKQPASVTGGIKAFVVKAWKKNEKSVNMLIPLFAGVKQKESEHID